MYKGAVARLECNVNLTLMQCIKGCGYMQMIKEVEYSLHTQLVCRIHPYRGTGMYMCDYGVSSTVRLVEP